jgi:hypothetical protein
MKGGTVGTSFGNLAVRKCLPRSEGMSDDSMAWFVGELHTKTLDQICLERLDRAIASGSVFTQDPEIAFWLNRYHGEDFDEWLSSNAPGVETFRSKELGRGFDPVKLLDYLRQGVLFTPQYEAFWGQSFEERCIPILFVATADRKAMKDLASLFKDHTLEKHLGKRGPSDLAKWFSANRSRLVYDPGKRRFVVGKPVERPATLESTGRQ